MGSYYLLGKESQFYKMEGVTEMGDGDSFINIMNVLNTNCIPQMVKMVYFMLNVF